MGEPRPPPGAPVLLLVLSLAGSSGGGQENRAIFVDQKSFPDQNLPGNRSKGDIGAALGEWKDHRPQGWPTRLKKPLQLWEKLPMVQQLQEHGRRRRAVFLPHPAPNGTKRLAAKGVHAQEDQSRLTSVQPTFREEKDPWKPTDPARRTLPNHPGGASLVPGHHHATKRGVRPPLSSAATEVGAAHEAGCRCPDSQRATVAVQEMEARQGGLRVPTPRTEEAAWAASALTVLLVLLTLAVLYTRLHRKCRRGPSLYWMTSSEEGRETVAAVMKRRLFSRPRRTKRPRQPPPRLLLPSSSSEDDSSA
ncbi:tumor protein p53-inducible protein 13 isoform X2 [Ahaetulla prasina]|uniref:tumor protein p53-inducible protein 13 isoform X2 n=1 Tax=Ahaetulla prasina TaxID=499056 RepID=UPI002647A2B3|nr:tumor protein p53-inducible protein 13 isoform X2 [Ahaetulla prasina]